MPLRKPKYPEYPLDEIADALNLTEDERMTLWCRRYLRADGKVRPMHVGTFLSAVSTVRGVYGKDRPLALYTEDR